MDLKWSDKLSLISGSTKGIGLAIAIGLAREGARVIVNGRTEKPVNEALAKIHKTAPHAKLEGFTGDLDSPRATFASSVRRDDVFPRHSIRKRARKSGRNG